jgi:predicted RND superfamily exporter protein
MPDTAPGLFERLSRACLRRRAAVIGIVLVVSALSVLQLTRARLGTDFVKLFMDEGGPAESYRELQERFDRPLTIVVAWPTDDALSAESLATQSRFAAEVRALPWVHSVIVAPEVPTLAPGEVLEQTTWGARLAAEGPSEAFWEAEEVASLIPRDRKTVAALVLVGAESRGDMVAQISQPQDLKDAAGRAGVAEDFVHLVGPPVVTTALVNTTLEHIKLIYPLTVFVALMLVLVLFRRIWPAVFTIAVSSVATLWAVALSTLVEPELTPLHALGPVLIVVLCLADTIFLLNAYLAAAAHRVQREAIVYAVREVGPACALTSLSTFFGFASLLLIPTPAIRIAGIVTGTGVAFALALVVTLGPVLIDLSPEPDVRIERRRRTWSARFAQACRRLAAARPRLMVAIGAVLFVGAAALLPSLEAETNWADRFDDDHPFSRSAHFIEERLGGGTMIDVIVDTPAPTSAANVRGLAALHASLAARDDVAQVVSIYTPLLRLHRALTDAPPGWDQAQVDQYLGLFELLGQEVPAALVASDALRVTVRVRALGLRETAQVSREIEWLAEAALGTDATASGLWVMLGRWLDNLYAAQLRSLVWMTIVTVLLLSFAFRSLRTGLVCLLPNLLPALLFVGSLPLLDQVFDSDLILLVLVGLGLAVDDTIHFVSRVRDGVVHQGLSTDDALGAAFKSAGHAMVQTTVVLVVGLSPLYFSDYQVARMFFTELSKIALGALFADLLLVPAMIKLGWMRFDR